MKIGISILTFLACFCQTSHNALAQFPRALAISVLGDARFARSQSNLTVGPRLSLQYSLSNAFSFGAVYSAGEIIQQYDTPTGISNSRVSMQTYRLVAGWVPFDASTLKIRFEIGAGLSSYSIPARMISLGALGERSIPAQSDQAVTYSLGVAVQKQIFPHVALQLSPEILISPAGSMREPVYCIGGGINIGIL